jgi:hypothetical protein
LKVNHQLESRMRESRLSGSEGGATHRSSLPLSITWNPVLPEMPVPINEPVAAENPEQRAKRQIRSEWYF